MRSSFAATLLACGTVLLLLPFLYHLVYYSNQSYVLAHRTDTAPNPDWGSYGPIFYPAQTAIGILGLTLIAVGFIGGTGVFSKKDKKDKDVRVPLDIVLKAHAPESVEQPTTQALPAAAEQPEKIGVRRIA